MFAEIIALIAVAALWGGTNPLIKRGTKEITKVKADTKFKQFILEVKYLVTNFGGSEFFDAHHVQLFSNLCDVVYLIVSAILMYIIPMGLNQLGSVLYFITLQHSDISLAVPVANSLTFVFTAVMGWLLNEDLPTKRTIIGVLLILGGTSMLCMDKYLQQKHI